MPFLFHCLGEVLFFFLSRQCNRASEKGQAMLLFCDFSISAVSIRHIACPGCISTGANNDNNIMSGFMGLNMKGYLAVFLCYRRNWHKKIF